MVLLQDRFLNISRPCFEFTVVHIDFRLTNDIINELGANGSDIIIISPQRLLDVSNYPVQCQSSIASKMFNISITDCEPFIQVRTLM